MPRKIFIVAGQSNAVGRSLDDGGALFPSGVTEFGPSAWQPVTHRIYHGTVEAANTTNANFGFDRQFAIDYLAANPADEIGFIGVAEGGTGFSPGDWNEGNPTYNRAVARVIAALAAHPGAYEVAGILWHQGEADAAAGETYAASLRAFATAFKAAIGAPNAPFVFGGHTCRSGNYNPLVHAAAQGMYNEMAFAGYAAADLPVDATLQDSVHLDAASIRALGSQMFIGWQEAFANNVLGGGGTITTGTPVVVASSIANPSTVTGVSIGAEDENRLVLVGVATRRTSSTCRPVSVTIGGVAARRVADAIDSILGGNTVAWFYAKIPTGTTANISVLLTSIPTAAQASIVVIPVYGARPHLANARAFRNYQFGNTAGTAFTLNPEVKTGDLILGLFASQTTAPPPISTSNLGAVTYLSQTNVTTAVASQIASADGAPDVTVTWDKTVNNPANVVIALRSLAVVAPEVDGTGAGTLPALVGAGAGGVNVSGTGAGTLARLTGAGAGAVAVSGTGAGTLPRFTGAGAGGVNVSGTGAGTLPALVGAGVGGNGAGATLDFVNDALTHPVTVIRAGVATVVNSIGQIEIAPENAPRYDYTDGVRSLLIEAAATNLMPRSNPTAADGSVNNATRENIAGPLRSFNGQALRVTRTTTGVVNQGFVLTGNHAGSIVAGNVYSISGLVRSNGQGAGMQNTSGLHCQISTAGNLIIPPSRYSLFVNGEVLATEQIALNDGWSYVSETVRAVASGGSGNYWLWGGQDHMRPIGANSDYSNLQFEVGLPSSFIPTSGAAVTRNADVATIDLPAGTYNRTTVTAAGSTIVSNIVHAGGAIELPQGRLRSVEFAQASAPEVDGTGAGTLPALDGAGVGGVLVSGTGAGTLPALDGAGVGDGIAPSVDGTGAGTLPRFTGAGAGGVAVSGAGVAVLPALIGVGNSGLLSSRRFAYANQSRNYLTG